MGLSKFAPWVLLAGLYFVPTQAVAAPAYACSVAEIFECTAVAGCQRDSAAQANLPPFVTLNVKEKALFSGLFGGQGLFSPGDVYEDPTVLILHGRHGLLTWTAVVAMSARCLCRLPIWAGLTRSSDPAPATIAVRCSREPGRLVFQPLPGVPICSKSVDNGDDRQSRGAPSPLKPHCRTNEVLRFVPG
jgi:hypothetical protein